MWALEIRLSETPERLAARPAHRELVARLHQEGKVRMSGPFADDTGALVLFDVEDQAEAEQLIASDPYYSTTGVEIVSVREWNPLFG